MKKFLNRKIILLALIAVFLGVYIFQSVSSRKNNIETIENENIDTILISYNDGEVEKKIRLAKENELYFAGEEKFPAEVSGAARIFDSVTNIKLLGKLASGTSDAERYGLNENARITVSALNGSEEVLKFYVGKDNSTNQQCYVNIEGKDGIYLAQNGMHAMMSVNVNDLRSKEIYRLDVDSISKITVKNQNESYELTKLAAGENEPKWSLNVLEGNALENPVDEKTAGTFATRVSSLTAMEFLPEDYSVEGKEPFVEISVKSGSKNVKVLFYSADNEDGEAVAVCSETPTKFTVDRALAETFGKSLGDFYLADNS
ncbi:MAG: DUF4340 domain-containing protein [Spirochaetales bacterium]|nr:DUF4340 domain-containing protein [Spirochaetales bacterium]